MSLPREQAWFAAKRYGYGWGLPLRWQGWLVFAGYFGVLFAGVPILTHSRALFLGYVAVWSAVFFAVCVWKGEPARWRWGKDS